MVSYRSIAVTGTTLLALAGCAPPPPGPGVMALPGQGKDLATFQQEDYDCQKFSANQAGIALPPPPPKPVVTKAGEQPPPPPPPPPPSEANRRLYEISYSQCMVAHGNTLQAVPVATAYTPYYPYPAAYQYPVMYGAGYPAYPYPFIYGGFYDTYGWGGGWHGGGGGWHGGGGFHR